MERILTGRIPTCTLDDVRNFADTSIFWGADPSNSHPRHLSRFSYYPRGEKRQKSYEEERTCVVVDVRKSPTARLCSNYYFRVAPGGDAEFMESMMAVLDGKIPKTGDKKRMIELGTVLKKTEFGVIFPGLGMVYSLQDKMDLFEELVTRLNEITTFKVVPMVGHYNMRGFNQLMLDQTGFINSVSFARRRRHSRARAGAERGRGGEELRCGAGHRLGSPIGSALWHRKGSGQDPAHRHRSAPVSHHGCGEGGHSFRHLRPGSRGHGSAHGRGEDKF